MTWNAGQLSEMGTCARLPTGSLFLKTVRPEMTADLFFRQLAFIYVTTRYFLLS